MYGRIKKHKENVEVNVFSGKQSTYHNIITKDPNTITQILIDLFVLGFPIIIAIKKFNERIKNKKDWLGV